ncbi:peptide/nickel transport system permease protein [Thermocatellispora tengchongensis]|uniref:Peptide/nickel transport system permease protein n=1 Tax=Thermocatellispora tengchongensis TaxID=1073253 RepID=A0A840PKS1_9ACTN|nr:ABC transporter permease [Thermocatellispora tengchongensis]MBB5138533.1 peptide/nickel transport system permease protein [Thermocatellispora tengchongensis]
MIAYFGKRLLGAAVVLFVVSVITFGLALLIPGDPAIHIAGEHATREEIAAVRAELGLDRPFPVRYLDWATAAIRGDLGTSLYNSEPVTEILAARLPVTLSLALAAMAVAVLISLPLGTLSALRPGGVLDRAISAVTALAVATPSFWLGLLLILVFAITFPVFPATGYRPLSDGLGAYAAHLALPAITLGVAAAVEPTRQLRAALADVLDTDYIRTARAKGLLPVTIVRKHAIRNAAVPYVTVIGLETGQLLGGAVVVETVFGLPGLGTLAEITVTRQDLPVLQGIVLAATLVVIAANLAVDLAYRWLAPGEAG